MAERKKIDRKRKELEKKIKVYNKNSKALCDMLALYSCFKNFDSSIEHVVYTLFENFVGNLEDKDVNMPFKAEKIEDLFLQDENNFKILLKELEANHYDELEKSLKRDYRLFYIERYLRQNRKLENHYNLFEEMCYYSNGLVSELLCSNIEISKRISILFDIIKHYIGISDLHTLKCTLLKDGNGSIFDRTTKELKEQKIAELCEAFRKEMESNANRKNELVEIIFEMSKDESADWICYLQEKKLVDFVNETKIVNIMHCDNIEVSLGILLCFNKINPLKKVYQLEDYNKLSEEVRASDNKFILESIPVTDITSFISLPNYKLSLEDVEIIGRKLFIYQKYYDKEKRELIKQIKNAIIHKAKNKEEYKTYCELMNTLEELADYKAYKRQQLEERMERVRIKAQQERELLNARYEFILRLSNMNESLQEQVPGKKVLKELVFQKPNQDD